jgi:CRISP-associated protein Cas1
MKNLPPTELKTILHSKRAHVYYLEHCRVLVKGGRVEYVTDQGKQSAYWNIPIANTTSILLGTGTSITQLAMRELAKAGVLVGFCGGGGTPLFSANELDVEVAWFCPQSEYRATEYLQAWVKFWFDDAQRLRAAKHLQQARLERIRKLWLGYKPLREAGFELAVEPFDAALNRAKANIEIAADNTALLLEEARLSQQLYALAAKASKYGAFTRGHRGSGTDPANQFLDHGNYLAYGLGATATWVLGLPHGLSVLHGKTRRGGLVFDVADLIKDASVLPQAFVSAVAGHDEGEFRRAVIQTLTQTEALDFMIDTLKDIAGGMGKDKL